MYVKKTAKKGQESVYLWLVYPDQQQPEDELQGHDGMCNVYTLRHVGSGPVTECTVCKP